MYPIVPLRRVATCLDGRRIPLNSEQRAELSGGYPYWGANGIVDYVGDYIFDETLVLLGEDGAPFGDPLKDVAFLVTGRTWVNNHMHVLRPVPGVDPRFLTYALNAVDWPRYISGATREKLTQEEMFRARVPLPSLRVQQSVADFLDAETARIGALIAKKHRQVELLTARLSLMEEVLVNEGSPRLVPLRWFVYVRSGDFISGEAFNEEATIPVIGGNGVMGMATRANVHERVVAVGRVGALCGNVHVVHPPAWITDNALIVRIRRDFETDFLAAALRVARLNQYAAQNAQPLITGETVKRLRVPLPEMVDQTRILDRLMSARAQATDLISILRRQQALLQERRQAIVTAAVRGEREVAAAP